MLTPGSGMTSEDLTKFANQRQFSASYMTSSKVGLNANEALVKLVEEIMKKTEAKKDATEEKISSNAAQKLGKNKQAQKKAGCC